MTLKEYLEKLKIDDIENDDEWMEEEWNFIKLYYNSYGFTREDLKTFSDRCDPEYLNDIGLPMIIDVIINQSGCSCTGFNESYGNFWIDIETDLPASKKHYFEEIIIEEPTVKNIIKNIVECANGYSANRIAVQEIYDAQRHELDNINVRELLEDQEFVENKLKSIAEELQKVYEVK